MTLRRNGCFMVMKTASTMSRIIRYWGWRFENAAKKPCKKVWILIVEQMNRLKNGCIIRSWSWSTSIQRSSLGILIRIIILWELKEWILYHYTAVFMPMTNTNSDAMNTPSRTPFGILGKPFRYFMTMFLPPPTCLQLIPNQISWPQSSFQFLPPRWNTQELWKTLLTIFPT